MRGDWELQQNFSRNIKIIMKERGLSYRALAEMVDIPFSTLYNYINLKREIHSDALEQIASKLDKTPGWLTSSHEDKL